MNRSTGWLSHVAEVVTKGTGEVERTANRAQVDVTFEALGAERSEAVSTLNQRISAVEPLLETELRHQPEQLTRQAIRANIRASANHLRHGSEVLERLIQREGLLVVGAEYSLETGVVDFFDRDRSA